MLRNVAGRDSRISFLDVDALFQADDSLPDADRFVDHVHFSLQGSYRLAAAWARALEDMPPFLGRVPEPMPSPERIRDVLLVTPFLELDFTRRVPARHGRPPFDAQSGSSNRMARWMAANAELERAVGDMDVDATRELVRQRMADDPADPFYALHWGRYLLALNRHAEAETVLRDVARTIPHRSNARVPLSLVRAAAGRPDDAADALLEGRRQHGFFAAAETFRNVDALLSNGQLDEALAFCRAVYRRIPAMDYRWRIRRAVDQLSHLSRLRNRAFAQMEAGNMPEAMRTWRSLVEIRHEMPDPFFWLGAYWILQGDLAAGEPWIEQSLRRWNPARGHYHAGLLEAKRGNLEDARARLSQAADAAQDDDELVHSLAWVVLSHPDVRLRDPNRARLLIAKVERGQPGGHASWRDHRRPMGWLLMDGPRTRSGG